MLGLGQGDVAQQPGARRHIEEALLEDVEESIDLSLVVLPFAGLRLGPAARRCLAEVRQHVAEDLDECAAKGVGLAVELFGQKSDLLDDEARCQL